MVIGAVTHVTINSVNPVAAIVTFITQRINTAATTVSKVPHQFSDAFASLESKFMATHTSAQCTPVGGINTSGFSKVADKTGAGRKLIGQLLDLQTPERHIHKLISQLLECLGL